MLRWCRPSQPPTVVHGSYSPRGHFAPVAAPTCLAGQEHSPLMRASEIALAATPGRPGWAP